jgi:hypothetical protein
MRLILCAGFPSSGGENARRAKGRDAKNRQSEGARQRCDCDEKSDARQRQGQEKRENRTRRRTARCGRTAQGVDDRHDRGPRISGIPAPSKNVILRIGSAPIYSLHV